MEYILGLYYDRAHIRSFRDSVYPEVVKSCGRIVRSHGPILLASKAIHQQIINYSRP